MRARLHFRTNVITNARLMSMSSGQLNDASFGTSRISRPKTVRESTSANNACSANHSARLAMTPTTAAVIAASAPLSALFCRSDSTYGAPRKIQRKQGTNVTHTVMQAVKIAASIGRSIPGVWYAAKKPTNCTTMMSGPGVLSASPSPSSICDGESQ